MKKLKKWQSIELCIIYGIKIILDSANADFEIDDDQSERFMDKDWETETVIPTLKLTDKSKKEEYVTYDGGHLFTLEVVY